VVLLISKFFGRKVKILEAGVQRRVENIAILLMQENSAPMKIIRNAYAIHFSIPFSASIDPLTINMGDLYPIMMTGKAFTDGGDLRVVTKADGFRSPLLYHTNWRSVPTTMSDSSEEHIFSRVSVPKSSSRTQKATRFDVIWPQWPRTVRFGRIQRGKIVSFSEAWSFSPICWGFPSSKGEKVHVCQTTMALQEMRRAALCRVEPLLVQIGCPTIAPQDLGRGLGEKRSTGPLHDRQIESEARVIGSSRSPPVEMCNNCSRCEMFLANEHEGSTTLPCLLFNYDEIMIAARKNSTRKIRRAGYRPGAWAPTESRPQCPNRVRLVNVIIFKEAMSRHGGARQPM
jgi:hypothetical protein